jgi:hypothetical protein
MFERFSNLFLANLILFLLTTENTEKDDFVILDFLCNFVCLVFKKS